MSINGFLYNHPCVRPAVDRAYAIVNAWPDSVHEGDRDAARLAASGWDGVALAEQIAIAILEQQGIDEYDLELFDEIYGEHCCSGVSESAMYELWDAERSKPR